MKKFVFTVKDEICTANGKDINATELLAKMKLYGSVEEYDNAVAAVRAEYQRTIDCLTEQIAAIKAHDLTADELALVKTYRACKTDVSNEFNQRIIALEGTLDKIKAEEEKRIAEEKERINQIIAMLKRNG